ncbi:MAG: response regulator [Anaerolineae bacterium]|jgi:CheY-like chemotaxis protein
MGRSLALIVEDDGDTATLFAEAAVEAGYEAEIVGSGDLALQRLASSTPALVILDLHLPGIDGVDVLKRIRDDEALAGTRVIVATADARQADALHEAADLVLVKPIAYGQLRDLAVRLSSPGRGEA